MTKAVKEVKKEETPKPKKSYMEIRNEKHKELVSKRTLEKRS